VLSIYEAFKYYTLSRAPSNPFALHVYHTAMEHCKPTLSYSSIARIVLWGCMYLQSGTATRATTTYSTAIFPQKLKNSNIVQRFASKIDGQEHCLPDFPEYAAFFTKFYCIWACENKFSAEQKQCWNMFVGEILLAQSLQCFNAQFAMILKNFSIALDRDQSDVILVMFFFIWVL
jgi:hypothetical protein